MRKILAFIGVAALFVFGVIVLPHGLYEDYQKNKNYTENGYTVECRAVSVGGTLKHKTVTAEYTDRDGKAHTAEFTSRVGSVGVGSTFTAYLLPDAPDEPWVEYDSGDIAFVVIFGGILFLLGISTPFMVVASIKENKLLDAEGKTVVGTIIATHVNSNGFKTGVIMFDTERGENRAEGVALEKYQDFGDDVQMEYVYDKKGKIHWRMK